MSSASRHRMHTRVTRAQLERRLGGEWEQDASDPTRRRNGRWETYREYSKVVPERMDCYVRNLKSGATRSAKTWGELATMLKAVVKR